MIDVELVRFPEVPVILTAARPVAAPAVAVRVRGIAPEEMAPKEAVTPAGRPEAAMLILPLKPPRAATATEMFAAPPWSRFTLAVVDESVNEGAVTIVTAIGEEADRVPELPVTITVAEPVTAAEVAVSVSVLPVNDAVTPLGRPDTLRATVPVKPF